MEYRLIVLDMLAMTPDAAVQARRREAALSPATAC
jgi:hypothetical protein